MEHHPQEYGGGYPGYAPPGWGGPPPGYGAQGAPPPGYGAPPPGYGAPPPNAPEYAAPPGAYPYAAGADGTPAGASVAGGTEGAEMAAMRSEIATLRAENGRLNKELSNLKAAAAAGSGGPNFYPPPYQPQGYGMPSPYGGYQSQYVPPGYGAPPRQAAPATLPMNIKNERGPKGANLAVFCIPNSYYDQQVLDLVNSYGNVIFCQVSGAHTCAKLRNAHINILCRTPPPERFRSEEALAETTP